MEVRVRLGYEVIVHGKRKQTTHDIVVLFGDCERELGFIHNKLCVLCQTILGLNTVHPFIDYEDPHVKISFRFDAQPKMLQAVDLETKLVRELYQVSAKCRNNLYIELRILGREKRD